MKNSNSNHYLDISKQDQKTIIAATKKFLNGYTAWTLKQKMYDHWDKTITKAANSDIAKTYMECHLRTDPLKSMATLNEHSAFLAEILTLRFIKKYSIKKTCEILATKYDENYYGERTINRYQNEALLDFAICCPLNHINF